MPASIEVFCSAIPYNPTACEPNSYQ